MRQNIEWIDIGDNLPEFNTTVLVMFERKKQGVIITQGCLRDEAEEIALEKAEQMKDVECEKIKERFKEIVEREYWVSKGYGLTWFNYDNRKIQNLDAKTSSNKVIKWAKL